MNLLLDNYLRLVIGHRGNAAHAPENTLESFTQAIALGADAIEFDVQLSGDGFPVVHHDPALGRTSDGSGLVASKSLTQLSAFDAGAHFTRDGGETYPYAGKGHRIPRFEEVLTGFTSTPLLIEIKTAAAAPAVRKAIESAGAEDRCLVDSYSSEAMAVFEGSRIPVGATRADVIRLMREVLSGRRVTPPKFSALCIPLSYYGLPIPARRFARLAPTQNFVVHVWTIDNPALAVNLWEAGVSGIVTNDPAAMIAARNAVSAKPVSRNEGGITGGRA